MGIYEVSRNLPIPSSQKITKQPEKWGFALSFPDAKSRLELNRFSRWIEGGTHRGLSVSWRSIEHIMGQ